MSIINSQTLNVMKKFQELDRNLRMNEEIKGKSLQVKNIKRNINDIFKWLIWFNKITKDAMLCPHCSKLWCNSWISKWINERKAECPHWRNPLTTRQLVNCRFASDVSDAINDLTEIRNIETDDENWSEHGTELKYFCKTWTVPICSDWAMFGTKHQNHTFEKLMDVYCVHLSKIKNEKEILDDKLSETSTKVIEIEKWIDEITKAKDEKYREIDKFVEGVHRKLETQMKDKVLYLLDK